MKQEQRPFPFFYSLIYSIKIETYLHAYTLTAEQFTFSLQLQIVSCKLAYMRGG